MYRTSLLQTGRRQLNPIKLDVRSFVSPSTPLLKNNFTNSYEKKLTSQLDISAIKSAPKIEQSVEEDRPSSKSYFTGNTTYYDLIVGLDQCLEYYTPNDPFYSDKLQPTDIVPYKERQFYWLSHNAMASYLKTDLTKNQYRSIIARLDRIAENDVNRLQSLPQSLREYLAKLSASGSLQEQQRKVVQLDSMGRAYSVGYRKEASVRCWLVKGEGKLMINGTPLAEYFGRYLDRENAVLPLALTNSLSKYNAWLIALGGGTTGQSQATSLALAKALIVHEPELETVLEEAKLLYRDPRVVERKKTGQPKARKKFTWVKR
ncbi:ribosomal protein S5 domain 2-like protein [Neoconidiobolus thromboides FSU 785]|nr:ribosomal protein S5 domain 2-like protein [Neoconidiobolus thromboides FSU 785]